MIKMAEIYVKIEPDSSNFEINTTGTYPKIHLRSKPQRGKANKELIKRLSKILNTGLRIKKGHRSRRKKLEVEGMDKVEIMEKLKGFDPE